MVCKQHIGIGLQTYRRVEGVAELYAQAYKGFIFPTYMKTSTEVSTTSCAESPRVKIPKSIARNVLFIMRFVWDNKNMIK